MYKSGDIIEVAVTNTTMLVVMASEEGVRYVDIENINYDNSGNVKTSYAQVKKLQECNAVVLGNIHNIVAGLKEGVGGKTDV